MNNKQQRRKSGARTIGDKRSILTNRLEEIVVFELSEDGNREYRTMTLRGLYNYVMKSITNRPSINAAMDAASGGTGPSRIVPPQRDLSGSECFDQEESPVTGPRKAISVPARVRSGSVTIADTVVAPSPSLPASSASTDSRSVNAFGQTPSTRSFRFRSSSRSVRFQQPLTPGTNSNGDNDQQTLQGEGADEADANAHCVTFRERLGGYLHPRDMRRLVTPFSSSNEPALIVRRHVMLLNFDPLRAIVLRDRLLVLVPDGADSILISLEKKLKGGIKELEKSIFGEDKSGTSTASILIDASFSSDVDGVERVVDDSISEAPELNKHEDEPLVQKTDMKGGRSIGTSSTSSDVADTELDFEGEEEWDEIENRIYLDLPFELQAVDAVLSSVSSLLSGDATELRHKVYIAMAALRGDSKSTTATPGDHAQERLRILKDGVGEMEARVQGFVRALNLVLDEDEDMALMNLSRLITHPWRFIQPVSQEILEEESDEPELIMEAYMQQSLSTANTLILLKGQISSTEELVALKLDAIRNKLLYISTIVSIASLCVATGSLVGSIFGMNLLNSLESDTNAFAQVLAGTLVGCFCLFIVLCWVAWRSGVFPSM